MANFSQTENKLIEKIGVGHLITSLHQLREAAEKIWSNDSPRIIQDYTDHGIKHYERIIEFIYLLLNINNSTPLSAKELYLLLSGVYMHDIGMQCDIIKHKEINEKAKELGAIYNSEIIASSSNTFSIPDQKQIRKNHHYLSAAWIYIAYKTNSTVLGPAIKSVPSEMIRDLMDVCLHHTKIPISNCPITFATDPNGRKQFVAALFRFADELDINSQRVNIETVENFRLTPENAIYWYIHNMTEVNIKDNLIYIIIRLNPFDQKSFGELIYNIFINGFEEKNKPVLDVLIKNGIGLRISTESKIIPDDLIDPFPEIITSKIKTIFSKHNSPLSELASEIKLWLEALNYEVLIEEPKNSVQILKATISAGIVKQNILIHCINSEISKTNVDNIEKQLGREFPDGWIITDTRVTIGARQRAADFNYIRVFNLAEFLDQMVWSSYFNIIKSSVESDKIEERYVQPNCYKSQTIMNEGREIEHIDSCGQLDKYIEDWLNERSKNHLSILGDFGSGKTWFCRHYTYFKINEYLQDPINKRLPLLITLRDFTKAITPEQLINDALIEKYKLTFIGSGFNIFQELNKKGKLLLILDGFDEMANKVDKQTIIDNFWELSKLVDEKSKIILTSRTEYFRWAKESETILGGEEKGRLTLQLTPPKFEVLYIDKFNESQIFEAIVKQLGRKQGEVIAKKVLSKKNLAEMSQKPVLIQLLLSIIEEIDPDILENTAQVYLYAINKLLLRNIKIQRTFTSTKDKLFFLCELAWEMIEKNELNIHYSSIPDIIKKFFGSKVEDSELDHWDFNLRSQTLLHRNIAGFYKFAHKSIVEFFVAYKFAAELGSLKLEYKNAFTEMDGNPCEFPILEKNINDLNISFGAVTIVDERMFAIRQFLKSMLNIDYEKLWDLYNLSKKHNFNKLSNNLIYILNDLDADFAGKNLNNLALDRINFNHSNLSKTNLHNTLLKNPSFYNTNFQNANLENVEILTHGQFHLIDYHGYKPTMTLLNNNILINLGHSTLFCDNIIDPGQSFELQLPNSKFNFHSLESNDNIIILTEDENIHIYDINYNYKLKIIKCNTGFLHQLVFDNNNNRFCIFSGKHESIYSTISILNIYDEYKKIEFTLNHGEIFDVCFGIKSDTLILGGRQGTLLFYNISKLSLFHIIPNFTSLVPDNLHSSSGYIYSMSLSKDEKFLIVGTTNKCLMILDYRTYEIIKIIPSSHYYTTVRFSKDGKFVLALGGHRVDIYMASNWKLLFHKIGVSEATFSTNSKYVVFGEKNNVANHKYNDIVYYDSPNYSVYNLDDFNEIFQISHSLDFSKTNIRGLKAPINYIKYFINRGATGWYTREMLHFLSPNEFASLIEFLGILDDNNNIEDKNELIDYIFKFLYD